MHRYTRSKNRWVFWSRIFGVGVVLFPLSIHHVDFRAAFTTGLQVAAHRASPAYAAFEDTRVNYADEEFNFPRISHHLATGTRFEFKPRRITVVRQITLAGLTIHESASPASTPGPVLPAPTVRALAISGSVIHHPLSMTAAPVSAMLRDNRGNLLPLNERKQQLLAELEQEDWTAPTVKSAAKELVQKEIRAAGGLPALRRSPQVASPTLPDVAMVDTQGKPVSPSDFMTASLMTRNPDPANLRPLWLTGQIEMTEGLAFVGPETQLVVRRQFNGYVFEKGRIWVSEGRFEIRVKEAVGYLVAELQTSDGRVLGTGEINLMDLRALPAHEDRVADLHIPLHPTADGATFRAISGYSHDQQKITVAGARVEIQSYSNPQKVNEDGYVSEPSLHRDSSFVARAVAKDHWPSLVVGQAQEPQDIRLFANSLVEALIGLSVDRNSRVDRREAELAGIIWGRLTQDGQPAVGAQVEMAGDYKPIYFNDLYLPDPRLEATGKNGLFAFIKVARGVQALRVRGADGHLYPAQIFPTENQHVSYVELEIHAKVVSQFKVFNAFDLSRPVSAAIRLVGNDETLNVGKDDFVEYSVAANPFMVEADGGGEFETTRVTVTGTPHVVHVPLIQRDWLNQLSVDQKIDLQRDRGTIVGLVDEPGYEIELTGYTPNETPQIFYLDGKGRVLDTHTGVAGGGFVIFNAPPGLQTLYVHGAQMRGTFSQVVVAEPSFVSVITH